MPERRICMEGRSEELQRFLDAAINAMIATGCDPLQIQRMKKKKLAVKDRMKNLEDRIIPDIIA